MNKSEKIPVLLLVNSFFDIFLTPLFVFITTRKPLIANPLKYMNLQVARWNQIVILLAAVMMMMVMMCCNTMKYFDGLNISTLN